MKIQNPEIAPLDIIIPLALTGTEGNCEHLVEDILSVHHRYGVHRFGLFFPSKGWQGHTDPPREHYIEYANIFRKVKEKLSPYGIACGRYIAATLKSGPTDELGHIIRKDGSKHPFAYCPIDPQFKKRFAENTALFAKLAKPEFIVAEDDYSLKAADGCYCDRHLKEFATRQGKPYSREELLDIFSHHTPDSFALLRAWRDLMRDSLVALAEATRAELDKESPEVSMGFCQSGGADHDGDCQ